MKVKVAQSCPTLCDSMDCNLPGSSLHGILQARILECIAFPFSRDLPNPGIKPMSPSLQVDSLPAEPQEKPKYVCLFYYCSVKSLSNCLFFFLLFKNFPCSNSPFAQHTFFTSVVALFMCFQTIWTYLPFLSRI